MPHFEQGEDDDGRSEEEREEEERIGTGLPDWRERVERFWVRREEVMDERRVAEGKVDGHDMSHREADEE